MNHHQIAARLKSANLYTLRTEIDLLFESHNELLNVCKRIGEIMQGISECSLCIDDLCGVHGEMRDALERRRLAAIKQAQQWEESDAD